MWTLLQQLLSLLDARGRWQLFALGCAMTAAALLEVVGVGAIIPFTTLLAQPDLAVQSKSLKWLTGVLGLSESKDLLTALGIATLALLVTTTALNIGGAWLTAKICSTQGTLLAERLLGSYLTRPYGYFLTRNTADMMRNVFGEVGGIVSNLMTPALTILARGLTALFLIVFLVALKPLVAVIVMIVFGGTYACLYLVLRRIIGRYGQAAIAARQQAYRAASEALGGIKDVKLHGLEAFMLQRFVTPSRNSARNESMTVVATSVPRYVLEVIALSGFVLVALYFVRHGDSNEPVAPLLAAYAFAGYRLMPSLQQIYAAAMQIRFSYPSLRLILAEHGLDEGGGRTATAPESDGMRINAPSPPPLQAGPGEIQFVAMGFTYPGAQAPTLRGIDLVIRPRTSIAVVGRTGSGKTTLIDLLLGLLTPTEGRILIDGIPLTAGTSRAWQDRIGYVPHNLYLTDDTITANIAFGVPPDEVDPREVERAAQVANLHDFIAGDLPEGYATVVGERGARLSSGQRQRIGIARALYRRPTILILDEATSALDYETEAVVMDAISRLAHQLTIIMIAHRLHTIEACDETYEVADGRLQRSRDRGCGTGGRTP